MIGAVRPRRLFAGTLACSAVVFGVAILVGNGRAQAGATMSFICSAPDKQFIGTVSSNLMQLGYWSDALVNHDVAPGVVVMQARAEAAQVGATAPLDRTLHATRGLLGAMFLEYSKAVAATTRGRDSTCLWHALRTLGYRVFALHVNHGLRGPDSAEDARFCREVLGAEVVELDGRGLSEAALREQRYSVGRGGVRATGHTASDQVETILYRLVSRGTATGMDARRADGGVRPP